MRASFYIMFFSVLIGLGTTFHATAQSNTSLELEEIVVTAQKRVESLEDIPITINVIIGEALGEYGGFSFNDFFDLVAGFSISGTNFDTDIATRGLGINFIAPVFSRVSTYMDGTFIA